MAFLYPQDNRSFLEIFGEGVLKVGNIPKHVAIIMDGNRRYANSKGLKVKYGHLQGQDKAMQILRWCYDIGVEQLTLYAFSTENFKRSKSEVDDLMNILEDSLLQMLAKTGQGTEHGFRFQLLGNWGQVPLNLKPLVARLCSDSKKSSKFTFNLALAYTGRGNLVRSIENILENQAWKPEEISGKIIEESGSLIPLKDVDLLIRTSGEARLSDFMMWEASNAHIHFVGCSWPEFSFSDFLKAIFEYQANIGKIYSEVAKSENLSAKHLARVENGKEEFWEVMEDWGQQAPKLDQKFEIDECSRIKKFSKRLVFEK